MTNMDLQIELIALKQDMREDGLISDVEGTELVKLTPKGNQLAKELFNQLPLRDRILISCYCGDVAVNEHLLRAKPAAEKP